MEFRAGLNPLKERKAYLWLQSNHHSCSVCFIYVWFIWWRYKWLSMHNIM